MSSFHDVEVGDVIREFEYSLPSLSGCDDLCLHFFSTPILSTKRPGGKIFVKVSLA